MKFICRQCQAQYQIADEKIGKKGVKVRCKKCADMIYVLKNGEVKQESAFAVTQIGKQTAAIFEDKDKEAIDDLLNQIETKAPQEQENSKPASLDAPVSAEKQTPDLIWFVAIQDNQVGPLSFEQVQTHWQNGDINAHSLAWRQGFFDWLPIDLIPDLANRLLDLPQKTANPVLSPSSFNPQAALALADLIKEIEPETPASPDLSAFNNQKIPTTPVRSLSAAPSQVQVHAVNESLDTLATPKPRQGIHPASWALLSFLGLFILFLGLVFLGVISVPALNRDKNIVPEREVNHVADKPSSFPQIETPPATDLPVRPSTAPSLPPSPTTVLSMPAEKRENSKQENKSREKELKPSKKLTTSAVISPVASLPSINKEPQQEISPVLPEKKTPERVPEKPQEKEVKELPPRTAKNDLDSLFESNSSLKPTLDKQEVLQVIHASSAAARKCVDNYVHNHPNILVPDRIFLKWVIVPTGQITQPEIEAPSLQGTNAESCLLSVIKRMKFPEYQKGNIPVKYPLSLN